MNKHRILDAIIVFIIAVIIILFINPYLVMALGITGMAVAELAFVVVAVVFVLLRREKPTERFGLKLPTIKSFFSAVVLMLGANMWENSAAYLYIAVFGEPSNTDTVFLETYFADASPMVALIAVALIPAVCEELLFRGYLFDSFKGKKNAAWAVGITALLFSVIHFDLYKMLPILIMGLAFGYITAKTGSVLIPIIFHFINNAMSLVAFYGLDTEETVTMVLERETYLWYAVGAFGAGLLLVYFGTRLLSGRARKKWLSITVSIVSVALFIIGIIGAVLSMMSFVYEGSYDSVIREDTVYTESFTLDEDSMAAMSAVVLCSKDVEGNICITDSHGDLVYDHSKSPSEIMVMLERGEYTVSYSFDVPEGSTVSHIVTATVTVMTVSEYETSDTEVQSI